MTARILVVDDIKANVDLLKQRLEIEYFEVLTAQSGQEALDILTQEAVDLILLDIMMPHMDGFEVCRRIKSNPATGHIPVVIVTALDGAKDRIQGLECGADDFLTKPVNDIQLLARVKSLVRLKMLTDELRLRAVTTRDIAIDQLLSQGFSAINERSNVLLIDERVSAFERISAALRKHARVQHVFNPNEAVATATEGEFDCVILSGNLKDVDPLRICSQIRSLNRTRFLPIIMALDSEQDRFVARALELGVNDYIIRPIDSNEMVARLRTQVRRKHYHDGLRANVAESVELAITDGLTGLNNRRYLDTHLQTLVERARHRGRELSLLITDIDRFKSINDTYGHDIGDDVLREFAQRLRQNVRGMDLACRYGGEEFVIVMPDTSAEIAFEVAERLRASIQEYAFEAADQVLDVTTSVGVATLDRASGEDMRALVKKADKALYEAKNGGRNRVISVAA